MTKIVDYRLAAEKVHMFVIHAPYIAREARPGQFVVIRADEQGERIPITICETDKENGLITLYIQEVGKSTWKIGKFRKGDSFLDIVGPLGKPAEIAMRGVIVTIGGGVGSAITFPETKAYKDAGNYVIGIMGFKNKDYIILEKEMTGICDELYITTDDGSYGFKGFVTDKLKEIMLSEKKIDEVLAIGPAVMMKAVCDATREKSIKTIVSVNSIMVDGTGMCGACRVDVGGKTKFACVDGPEFDGHLVNFDLLIKRANMYKKEENEAYNKKDLV